MTQSYIDQVLEHFSAELTKTEDQAMTLSLRAHLLYEVKRLRETLKALIVQSELSHSQIFFINTLDHFIACARLERADKLQVHCSLLNSEVARVRSGAGSQKIEQRSRWGTGQVMSGEGVQAISV